MDAVVEGGGVPKSLEDDDTSLTPRVVLLTIGSGIAFFMFGYDTGVVSTAMTWCRDDLGLGTFDTELAISVTTAGAAVFSLIAAPLNDWLGRRVVIQAAGVLFIAGAALVAVANGLATLVAGRTVLGAAIGLGTTTVPLYVAEARARCDRSID